MDQLVILEPQDIFNPMIIGVSQVPYAVVYDMDKIIDYYAQQMRKDSESDEEAYSLAVEYFEYNYEASHVGENTPLYVSLSQGETLLELVDIKEEVEGAISS
jgi:hypothetical protein